MRRFRPWAVASATLLLAFVPSQGEEAVVSQSPVIAEIRTLFGLQDAAANGNAEAVDLQRQLLSQMKQQQQEDLVGLRPDAYTAAMIAGYVLSGGQPELAEALASDEKLDHLSKSLLEGAALYMRGDREKAGEQLKVIEPTRLPLQIGGRVALARAMLSTADHVERERLLALAIALMPGTLVEESALRRSASTQAELGNAELFWNRTERYLRRFPGSLYAPEFMAQAVGRVADFEAAGKPGGTKRLEAVLMRLPPAQRRTLYLKLARAAASRNLPPLTQFAARQLRGLSTGGSTEMMQADLYDSLHDVTGSGYGETVMRLEKIDATMLEEGDRALLRAALAIAGQIRAPGMTAGSTADEAAMNAAQPPEILALVDRAKTAISSADRLLQRVSQ